MAMTDQRYTSILSCKTEDKLSCDSFETAIRLLLRTYLGSEKRPLCDVNSKGPD